MVSRQRNVSFSINGMDKIPIVYVADVFQHLQNILYSIGDHLEGNEPRPKGVYPQSVKDNCSLVITGLDSGSVHAQMQIGDAQESLPGMPTLGENSISIANNLLKIISEKGGLENRDALHLQLFEAINNPHRLNRILREYDSIWPDNQSKIALDFKFGKSPKLTLNPSKKEIIQSLLKKTPDEYEKQVEGRLIELRVDKKREFKIDSPEGLIHCEYSPEIEDIIINSIGDFVRIRGTMKPKGGKFVLNIEDETSLDMLPHFEINKYELDSIEKQLNEPISIDIVFEGEQYIASNDELGLLVVAPSMKLANEGLQEEIAILLSEYVDIKEQELTKGAKEFRTKLIELTG
jgi:hypothetical protein